MLAKTREKDKAPFSVRGRARPSSHSIADRRGYLWHVLETARAENHSTSMQRGVTATLEANSQEVRNQWH